MAASMLPVLPLSTAWQAGTEKERAMTASTPQEPPAWQASPSTQTGPTVGYIYGGFWVRVLAFILDAIILGVLTSAIAPLSGTGTMVQVQGGVFEINYGANAVGTLVGLLYFIGFWVWRGQTPGMMPFNMRVVRADTGEQVDWVRGLLRYVGLLISFVVIFIGVIWAAFDSRKQGWHDKIANTVVVRPA
jgi:uncharacterized RDD family membrane protein YckC